MTRCVQFLPSDICLEVIQGVDAWLEFILTDERNEPVSLSGATVTFLVKDSLGGTTKLSKSNGPGEHEDVANGKTRFKILDSDIAALTESEKWVYEIRRIKSDLDELVHIKGNFIVRPSVGG